MLITPFKKIDWVLVFITAALLTVGLLAIYSATYAAQSGGSENFSRQLMLSLIGFFLMLGMTFFPFRWLQRLAYLFYGLSILLLFLVFFIGAKGYGAERWIILAGIKLQPAELAKLATILAVAAYVAEYDVNVNRFKHFLVVSFLVFLPMVLIARQPDLGTSLVFIAMFIPLLFWAGLNRFALFVIVAPAITLFVSFNFYAFLVWMLIVSAVLFFSGRKPIILISIFVFHIIVGLLTPMMWNQLRPYQQKRLLTFINPETDPRGAGYQIIQSKVAIGSGGFWGKGYLNGSQTQLKFLPAQHTDFIFSVIGEEWGFAGVLVILGLFFLLLLYLLHLAVQMRSSFASLTLVGIITVLFFHIFVNIGMTVGLAPVTGLPLPFISYGGSFLVVTLMMMGIAMNFSANRYHQ
ncbi:MAG TPA: rod shape-determining protein RodA [Calditrichaeota bacterium]|nr:rod shape-determining protein RodA [Calditrichota bacterium]